MRLFSGVFFSVGHVVPMGVAESPQEAGLAAQKIRAIKGVKDLTSHHRVVAKKN